MPLRGFFISSLPTDSCVGKVEMSRITKLGSLKFTVAPASLYCPIVKAQKRKIFLLLLQRKNP